MKILIVVHQLSFAACNKVVVQLKFFSLSCFGFVRCVACVGPGFSLDLFGYDTSVETCGCTLLKK